jgi:hypothetical protein
MRQLALHLVFVSLILLAPAAGAAEPLRLPDGEPLVCIYYFTHWWEPWKSDDNAILNDFRVLRAMGFNTLLLDQEWSQAIDGDWKWLDRDFRLAAQAGLKIVPWLSPKTWSDISPGVRANRAREWFGVEMRYGVTQDGKEAAPLIYDESVLTAGAKYAAMYLGRYLSQPLLRLRWKGKDRPVICLSVESAWDGSFDESTNLLFCRWLRGGYKNVGALNAAWGTKYSDFFDVDPRDASIFDYPGQIAGKANHPAAVEDHVEFRAEMISDSLARMTALVRRKYPDVLFLAEIPYQYGSEHPHARAYRITYGANPRSCDYADIVLFRSTGPLDDAEAKVLRDYQARTGQKFVLTYRTYSDWDIAPDSPAFSNAVSLYAGQAASLASGFGFYSFNEMGDTHMAYSPAMSAGEQKGWTPERSQRAIALLEAMVKRYREIAGPR